MKILSIEEKTELLCKIMAGLGISANDFMNQFKDDEPIIKESGETFVLKHDGVDYICTGPDSNGSPPAVVLLDGKPHPQGRWEPIEGFKITDKIAKLRPMVISGNGFKTKLYGVINDGYISIHGILAKDCHILATVDDLSEPDDSVLMCLNCYCANDPARVTCSECGTGLKS